MSIEEVVIQPKTEGKGRSFKALRVSSVTADALWEMGKCEKHDRPVYASFAASEGEIRPFVANLLCGRVAVPLSSANRSYRRNRTAESGYEFMRSAGYKVIYQRHEEGSIATIFLPELLDLDPGMVDPKGIKFVVIPGADYLADEAKKMPVQDVVDYARALPLVKEVNEPERDWQGHIRQGWEEQLSREKLAEWVPLSYLVALRLFEQVTGPNPARPEVLHADVLGMFQARNRLYVLVEHV